MPLGAVPISQPLIDALAEQERKRLAAIEQQKRDARLMPVPIGTDNIGPPPDTRPESIIPRPEDRPIPLAAPNVVQPLAPIAPGQDPGYQGTLGPKGTGIPISGRFDKLNGPGRVAPAGEPPLDPSNPAGSANPPNFNAAQRYLGGQKIAGMVENLNAMEGVGPNAPIVEQQNPMVGGPLPGSLGDKAPANIVAMQNRANLGAEAGVVPGLEKDHPTKWGRFKNALGAFGLSMLQGRGLLGSGYAAYEGAKASQRGSGDLGRFGDRMEDADDLYEAQVKARKAEAIDAPLKTKREVEEQMARIRLLNAQAGYQEAKPELDEKRIRAQAENQMRRALEATDDDIREQAKFVVRYYEDQGKTPPIDAWQAATGRKDEPLPVSIKYAIVAGYDAVYGVNRNNLDDARRIGGVVPKPPADPGLGNRAELAVRQRFGDPEGPSKRNNPEYDAWLKANGQNELLNTYAGENMKTFGMDNATYRAYINGEAPQKLKEKVWAAWQALSPEEQDVYAAKLKAPKRVRVNKDDPEWIAQYNRALAEEEQKYRSAGPAQPTTAGGQPVERKPDTRSEAQVQTDGRAWAEKNKAQYNNDVNAAYEAYMAEWRRQRATADK